MDIRRFLLQIITMRGRAMLCRKKNEVLGIENNRPVVLYDGQVSKEKGALELPPFFKSVNKVIPHVYLWILNIVHYLK